MDDLHDELDLRYHRDLKPDVYYRCPSSESLDGALRNEFDKHASSLIPMDIVTEFVFGKTSTITVPVTQQPNLDILFEPADHAQSIAVEHALCNGIEGKERLKLQRAIARSFIEMIQEIDGFKYIERQASNKEGCDGVRFKYVCLDSLQNRKARVKREKDAKEMDSTRKQKRDQVADLAMHDCGGAIHIKFSTTREAVNVVYVHNPIHRDIESRAVNRESLLQDISTSATGQAANGTLDGTSNGTSNAAKSKKRKQNKKDHHVEADTAHYNAGLNMSTSPETSTKKRRTKDAAVSGASSSATKKSKTKQQNPPTRAREKATAKDSTSVLVRAVRGACLRCRSMGIKCNEAKPNCNQCLRGLWACQWEAPGPKKRSKNGCLNCKSRKRKCTEEKPACAYCLKIDNDCIYGE